MGNSSDGAPDILSVMRDISAHRNMIFTSLPHMQIARIDCRDYREKP